MELSNLNQIFKLNKNESIDSKIIDRKTYYEIHINYKIIDNYDSVNYIRNNYIGLPIELNRIIANFLIEYKYIKIAFTVQTTTIFPFDFPYYPPNWSLLLIKSNMNTNYKLNKYFKKLVDDYNKNNFIFWKYNIDLEADIKNFISFINHFNKIYINQKN
jgi:hypothetical protein